MASKKTSQHQARAEGVCLPTKQFAKGEHHFADRLVSAIKAKGSPICVGLDPRLDQIPKFIAEKHILKHGQSFEAAANTIVEFNKGIIDAVYDLVPIVKPQFAFYLQYGSHGVRAFEETCAYATEKGLLVLADAKVNDIGSTAQSYAQTFIGEADVFDAKAPALACDALTVNAYLGYDGIKPFVEACKKYNKGIFVLVKTSNPSSGDIQDRVTVEEKISIAELMAHFVDSWGSDEIGQSGYSSIGAVVGATYPAEAAKLRVLMPQSYFLVPGYGAQGGSAKDVKPCFNEDGLGAIISSSRDITFAWQKEGTEKKYGAAARAAVERMAADLASIF